MAFLKRIYLRIKQTHRGTTFRSSTDEIFETLTWNNKTRQRKESLYQAKNWSTEHSKGNKTLPVKVSTTCTEDGHNRLPKQALQCKSKGRRNIGRPRKRWRDQLHLEDQGKG